MNITKPTLLVNEEIVKKHIQQMTLKASNSDVHFRPHFKTHQSAKIGEWFKEQGVNSITVSSVDMAKYFMENGWRDILIAFAINILQIDEINAMAEKIDLHLLIENQESLDFLIDEINHSINIWLKIDTAYHRTGFLWNNIKKIREICELSNENDKITLTGFLTHSGHTYHAQSIREIKQIYADTTQKMGFLKNKIQKATNLSLDISIGDTPSCTVIDDFHEVDEIRPGNFVFYDLMQKELGVCLSEDIAVALACPVIANHAERNEIIIYGGAIHLSKEYLPISAGKKNYGQIFLDPINNWGALEKDTYISSLSQEHGKITTTNSKIRELKIGEIVYVVPIHSCLTANLMRKYYTLSGEQIMMNPY